MTFAKTEQNQKQPPKLKKKKKITPDTPRRPIPLPAPPRNMPVAKPAKATLTPKQMRQLHVLAKLKGGMSPHVFAKRMWPDSPGWKKECVIGAGPKSVGKFLTKKKGGAMNITAGAALGKLRKAGYVVRESASRNDTGIFKLSTLGNTTYRADLEVYRTLRKKK